MKCVSLAVLLMSLIPSLANAGCARNWYDGETYCGPGGCKAHRRTGVVYCSKAAGGKAKHDQYGNVICNGNPDRWSEFSGSYCQYGS